jgi:hypothetical protein
MEQINNALPYPDCSAAPRIIAIIGHGRSPEGRGWGPVIDACDIVIRMWDWHWQDPKDYGIKYDYGVFEAHPTMMTHFNKHRERTPARGWVASVLMRTKPDLLPPCTVTVDQNRVWVRRGRQLGGQGVSGRLQFSRGIVATLWAIEQARKDDQIVLVGFDNVHTGKTLTVEDGFPEVYRKAPSTFTFRGYIEGVRRYGNHDFGIERPLIELLAEENKIHIGFAQDLWT